MEGNSYLKQNQFLRDAVFEMVWFALLAVTGSKGKASVSDKLHDHSDYVLIWQKLQQLGGKSTVPNSVICRCQLDKYSTSLLNLKNIIDILGQKNSLIHDWLPTSKPSLLFREQWINNLFKTSIDKALEDLVGDRILKRLIYG